MRKLVHLLSLSAVIFFACANAWSAPSAQSRLTKAQIPSGESLSLIVEISWPQTEGSYKFGLPDLSAQHLTVTGMGESQETVLQGDTSLLKKTFTVEFQSQPGYKGKAHINPFSVSYFQTEGVSPGNLSVPGFDVEITAKPLNDKVRAGIFAAGALISIVLIVWIVRSWRKKKDSNLSTETASDEDICIEQIESRLSRLSPENAKDALRDIGAELKLFLVKRYGLDAEPTNEKQTLEALKSKQLPYPEIQKVEGIFQQIHQARYSGAPVTERDVRGIAGEITGYINSKRIIGAGA